MILFTIGQKCISYLALTLPGAVVKRTRWEQVLTDHTGRTEATKPVNGAKVDLAESPEGKKLSKQRSLISYLPIFLPLAV